MGRQEVVIRLFLASFLVLFVELLFLRWIPANIRYVGFFPNFLLIGSFLGIGLGIMAGRSGRSLRVSLFPLVLFGLVAVVANAQLIVQLRTANELVFGLASNPHAADVNYLVLPTVVIATSLVMAALATPLGSLFRQLPPLHAYAVDIAGSLTGIATFTILSALQTPPAAWFLVVAAAVAAGAVGRPATAWRLASVVAMAAVVYMSAVAPGLGALDRWSPYYRLTTLGTDPVSIYGNGLPFQAMWPARDPLRPEIYKKVYELFPGRTWRHALIIGAGSGTDTATAIAQGVDEIDAVEIDPVIADIGRRLHPDRPYADPRVTVHIDDGRNFLEQSRKTYDLVIFALPDSLTLLNAAGNLRLESFLFTEESLAAAARVVAPDGVLVMYNWYREPWLVARIAELAKGAFGTRPIVRTYNTNESLIVVGHTDLARLGAWSDSQVRREVMAPETGPTDDWPYLYLRQPGIAPAYLAALAAVLAFAVVAVALVGRSSGLSAGDFSPHFFALGAAFLLIETRSLVSFSLLFGSTWVVNALVFFGILLSVLAAIGITALVRPRRRQPIYALLFASLGVGYALNPAALLIDPPALRYAVASAVAFAPIFLANMAFAFAFRDTRRAELSFASNLLGAVAGGAIEYVALITGYRALLLIAAAIYLLALLLATRFQFLADRDLSMPA